MSVVTATITSNGSPIKPEFELLYVDVSHEYNRVPSAEICYQDGDLATQEFRLSDSNLFEPGAEIEIKLRYEGEPSAEKTVFKGVVLKHGLQTSVNGSVLIAELVDKAVKMTSKRKSLISLDTKDSDVIQKLISENGLNGSVESTSGVHKKLIQYNVTDWDFMVSRAEVNGLWISVEGGKISAKKPSLDAKPVLILEFGIAEIFDFELEADARNQVASVETSGWNVKDQKMIVATGKKMALRQGNLKPDKLANVVDGKKDGLISGVDIDQTELQNWADAKIVKSHLSMLKGRVKVQGTAQVKVGDMVTLKGMGKRFSGSTLVSGVRHQVTGDGWTTDIQFGGDADWFLSKNMNVVAPKAGGLLPGVNGLQVGIVKKIDDPDKEERVQVMLPATDSEKEIWARITAIDGGNARGVTFWPEPGDEVIVGFLNDDPRQPVILGSVHSSKNPSPVQAAEKNPEKGIVTREGLKMLFNDEEKTVVISTSDDNVITINDKEKSIEVKDANNNSVLLSDKGISMKSDKDVIINAGGNVKIEGKAVEIKGNKVDVI